MKDGGNVSAWVRREIKRFRDIKQAMELNDVLVENTSVENVSSQMIIKLRKICESKLLAQNYLTSEQEKKYEEYENTINKKPRNVMINIKIVICVEIYS